MRLKNFKRTVTYILLSSLFVLSSGCSARNKSSSEEWRFALEEIKGSVQYAYASKFKELIEDKTDNKVKVTIYPYGTLGTSDQITELVNNGAVHFAMSSPGHLGKLIPEVQVFLLHFLFSDNEEVNKRVFGRIPELDTGFDQLYAEKGLKLLAFYPEGWQVWTTSKMIREPEDFGGLKMRVMTSPLLIESYKAYGASPTILPYSEVYSALQLKMIDGQVNPAFAIEEMSFFEVTDYMIFPKHAQFITSAIASNKFYKKLSPERKEILNDVIAELNDYIYNLQKQYNEERMEIIREKKPDLEMVYLKSEERRKFRKASESVKKMYVDMVGDKGKKILELIRNEVSVQKEKMAEEQENKISSLEKSK